MKTKLSEFDALAEKAVDDYLHFIYDHREALVALARGRLVTGHFIYGESEMFEFDPHRLDKERAEEFADGLNYTFARLQKL